MLDIRPVHRGWRAALDDLVCAPRERLTVASPYITEQGAGSIIAMIGSSLIDHGRLDIVTDLSPAHVCDGSLEPAAIGKMMSATATAYLWHVPKFHAKVYIADRSQAIVTSGNLTASAFYQNVEYGLDIRNSHLVAAIDNDLADIKLLGVNVAREQLSEYIDVAIRVRESFRRQEASVDPALRRAFMNAVRTAEDDLIRLRLAGGAMHTVFANTIVHLLRKHGAMRTAMLHGLIRSLHPELCDDSVDRVIDGRHFGKKWKHAVRTAQQQAKKLGLIDNDGELWHIKD